MPESTEWGIGAYLGRICLPSLLFGALARLEVSTLNPIILTSILIASLLIWVLAAGLGLLATRSSEHVGERQMTCALFALFVTMGDDIGMGLPLMTSIGILPELTPLVFITSALGSLTTAPMGYALLAFGGANLESLSTGARVDLQQIVWKSLRDLRNNVLIRSCLLGGAYNLIFGNDLPWFLSDILDTLGAPFMPLVFLLAGMSSVGTFSSFGSLQGVALPFALVLMKSLVLALLTYWIVLLLGGSESEQNWAFVYSLMPTATSLLVIARGYGFNASTMSMLSAALMLSKLVSFLLLFVAGARRVHTTHRGASTHRALLLYSRARLRHTPLHAPLRPCVPSLTHAPWEGIVLDMPHRASSRACRWNAPQPPSSPSVMIRALWPT